MREKIKLESSVSVGNQFQGFLVEEDANDWLRFDVYSNGTQHRALIARSLSEICSRSLSLIHI